MSLHADAAGLPAAARETPRGALQATVRDAPRKAATRKARLPRALVAGSVLLAVILFLALSADLFYPADPRDMVGRPSLWPGTDATLPLGTDAMGRDIAAAMAHASRVSLAVGIAAMTIAVLVGTLVGVVSGYLGGLADDVLMRVCELFQTLPSLLFTIILVVILGPSVPSVAFAIGITSWPQVARLVRAEALRVRQLDYVQAAVTMGMGPARILLVHVLPNSIAPVVVAASILVAQAILTDASLSFLGLGDPNILSWGGMVGAGRPMLRTAWYMTAIPGTAIFLTVMAFMLIGNGLNDFLNPRKA